MIIQWKPRVVRFFYRKNPDIGNSRCLLPPLTVHRARLVRTLKTIRAVFRGHKKINTPMCAIICRVGTAESTELLNGSIPAMLLNRRVHRRAKNQFPARRSVIAPVCENNESFSGVCVCDSRLFRREFIDRFVGTLVVNKQTTYGSTMYFWHLFTTCDVGFALFLFLFFLRATDLESFACLHASGWETLK